MLKLLQSQSLRDIASRTSFYNENRWCTAGFLSLSLSLSLSLFLSLPVCFGRLYVSLHVCGLSRTCVLENDLF